MNASDVTVVIPTYRRPRLLARALESVVRQATPGLRVRVLDNASGDETPRVVAAFAERWPIEYVCHATNLGCSANIQAAIGSVTTPYCAILNDDDMQLPGLVSAAIEGLSRHPSAGAFCGRTLRYQASANGGASSVGTQGVSWRAGFYRAGAETLHMVREHFTPTAVVFKADALKAARFTFGDMEMMARIAERNDLVVSERILGVYVIHPGAWSASHSDEAEVRATLDRLRDYLELETLTGVERTEVVARALTQLMTQRFWRSLRLAFAGESSAASRRDLAGAAALLAALERDESDWAIRLHYLASAAIAGAGEAPFSRAGMVALQAVKKISGGIQRLRHGPRGWTTAEEAAVVQVASLDRAAEAIFGDLVSRGNPVGAPQPPPAGAPD